MAHHRLTPDRPRCASPHCGPNKPQVVVIASATTWRAPLNRCRMHGYGNDGALRAFTVFRPFTLPSWRTCPPWAGLWPDAERSTSELVDTTRRLRVLHVCQPTVDGAPNVLLTLAQDQLRRDWQVHVAGPQSSGYLIERAAQLGARTHPWEATRSPSPTIRAELAALRTILRETTPDVVHLHSSKAGLVGRLAVRGSIPTIFQPHAWSYEAVSGPMRHASIRWERLATRWTDLTLCVGRTELETGARHGTLAPRQVAIPNGVDTDRHRPRDRAQCRRELSVAAADKLVLCVGRLTRQKGQDVLLQAWPAILREVPHARLVFLGEGPDRADLLALIDTLGIAGSVEFHPVQDPRSWFGAADVIAMPSRWEGMPLVLLEAMASGRCVVAADVAGFQDAMGPGSHLVATADPDALGQAITARLTDSGLAQREAEKWRRVAERDFTSETAANRVAECTLALATGG
ncbi:MAG: glycosyl transferase [Micrococcales bacterium]|nr:MAG: glycosyl transferase [Micrococcales bacterium]